jgi:hypothetical protein
MQMPVSEPENLTDDSGEGESDAEWLVQENISKRQQTFNKAMYVILIFTR